jgi:EAL domain-containing protein (putative c-di-GMP-specific phosphodiesterase class I)
MAKQRTDVQQQLAELLLTAKKSLRLSVSFISRMDGTTQHLEVVESSVPVLFKEGGTQRQSTSFCQAIRDGKLPSVIPDVKRYPAAMALPASRIPRIRSYVSVPITFSDGTAYGTFCAAGLTSDKELGKRDQALMEVLASAAAVILEPSVAEEQRRAEIEGRLGGVVAAGGPTVLLQPIVALTTGRRTGAEALSRFPRDWGRPPDVCFEEAHSVGQGERLELMALERALQRGAGLPGYVAVNLSPGTLLGEECTRLLDRWPLDGVLLELSEHEPVEDYDALTAALAPYRARGLHVAIDDVGAGFSSLRHIVLTDPDVIKLDRSIVAGVAEDRVLTTLVRSLVDFAHDCGAGVVAEGIETAADVTVLPSLGVDHGQGWFFGKADEPEALLEQYAVPAAA